MRNAFVLVAAIMLTASAALGIDGDMGQGEGTELNPYLIQDMIDFDKFANPNNSTTYWATGVHTKLACNIDFSLKPAYKTAVIAADSPDSGWSGTPFSGIFDGDGHTINNLTINTEGVNNYYLGLFGYIDGADAEIKNLAIVNCNITGGNYSSELGGLCGYNDYGTISNCYATGSVSGFSYLGGLCGYSDYGTITNCYTTCSIAGDRYSGNLCGYNYYGIITNCYATGSITGDDHLGGLCGRNYYGTITNCYATGSVTGDSFLGGLCGYNDYGTITNCYATSSVTGDRYSAGLCGYNIYGTITNCYYYLFCGVGDPDAIAIDDLQMLDADSFTGFDFVGNTQDGDEDIWDIISGHCPKLSWQTDDGSAAPTPPDTTLTGNGHSYDPFQINSYTDFIEFRTNESLRCGYYILTTNIDLSSDTFSTAVVNNGFYGHFDGDGHTINNLTIDTAGAENDYLGLFAHIRSVSAEVKNLAIVNCNITGGLDSDYLGGLCGRNYYGTITNCYATGSVTGGGYLGGLCGSNYYTITNCYSTSSVNGNDSLGGLSGSNLGTITNCYYYLFCGAGDSGGIALDDLRMLDAVSFTGFDFAGNTQDGEEDIWDITSSYCPKLSWQTDDGPAAPILSITTTLTGRGYSYDPFQINSYADFIEFSTNESLRCGYYIMTTDIDLGGDTFSTALINVFYGHFDGDGHIINNLTIDTAGANTGHLGLFGEISCVSTQVKNLAIVNCNITGGLDSDYLGGLCGKNSYGIITNCYATGSITGEDYLGNLCGVNSGTITNCYATGAITGNRFLGGLCGYNSSGTITNCYATGSVTGNSGLGGMCGDNSFGTISNCYATGAVTGDDLLGGMCGNNYGRGQSKIINCYATGLVIGGADSVNVGGFCGRSPDIITNCFWDVESSGLAVSFGGVGLSTLLMQSVGTFVGVGWDFSDGDGDAAEWWICDGRDYPKLFWQPFGDLNNDSHVNSADLAIMAGQWDLKKLVWDISPSNGDGRVNIRDFAVFANGWTASAEDYIDIDDFTQQWLRAGATGADIAPEPLGDGVVDILDLQAIAENWLKGPAF